MKILIGFLGLALIGSHANGVRIEKLHVSSVSRGEQVSGVVVDGLCSDLKKVSIGSYDVDLSCMDDPGVNFSFLVPKNVASGVQYLYINGNNDANRATKIEILPDITNFFIIQSGEPDPFSKILADIKSKYKFEPIDGVNLTEVEIFINYFAGRKNFKIEQLKIPIYNDPSRPSGPIDFTIPTMPILLPTLGETIKFDWYSTVETKYNSFTLPSAQLKKTIPPFVLAEVLKSTLPDFRVPNYNNKVCGSTITTLNTEGLSLGNSKIVKIIRSVGNKNVFIAPDTIGRPPGVVNTEDLRLDTARVDQYLNETKKGFESLGNFANFTKNFKERFAIVYLLDTLDKNGVDHAGESRYTIDGIEHTVKAHGSIVKSLIEKLNAYAEVRPIQTCEGDKCNLADVVTALCAAGEAVAAEHRPVIVNASLSSAYDIPIIRGAIEDISKAGVAIVAAYGNRDRCQKGTTPLDYCNSYPADYSNEIANLYSVGANQQNNQYVQNFERGYPSKEGDPSTGKIPTISAPSFYWLSTNPDNEDDLLPYKGSSFAAPMLTGMLTIWIQENQNCRQWPNIAGHVDKFLQTQEKPSYYQNRPTLTIEGLMKIKCPLS